VILGGAGLFFDEKRVRLGLSIFGFDRSQENLKGRAREYRGLS